MRERVHKSCPEVTYSCLEIVMWNSGKHLVRTDVVYDVMFPAVILVNGAQMTLQVT